MRNRAADKLDVLVRVVLAVVWLLSVAVSPAQAYIDPGSGGMLAQLLLGGMAGAAVLLRLYWARFLTALGLRKRDTDAAR